MTDQKTTPASEVTMPDNDNMPQEPIGAIDVVGDAEAMFNLRDWMEGILKANQCEITGTGMGFGGGDIWFQHQGAEYFLTVKPVMK